ncbi:MAG: NAD(P)/FAD-dependent oxidoreductase [Armatimonadota bacterium]
MDYDCAIIGAGPSGLHTGTYLGRYRRHTIIFDGWKRRAEWIPVTHNFPAIPEGITGQDLLNRMTEQCKLYGAEIRNEPVEAVEGTDGVFLINGTKSEISAKKIVLATGVCDVPPHIPNAAHYKGQTIRHCPLCDAYEARDQKIVVFGHHDKAARQSIWLSSYTNDLTILTMGLSTKDDINPELRRILDQLHIDIYESPVEHIEEKGKTLGDITLEDGTLIKDVFRGYSAMGLMPNSSLAESMGVLLDSEGYIITDNHQKTNIEGVYAVGDIVSGELGQISVAVGHAATAATSVHNSMLII